MWIIPVLIGGDAAGGDSVMDRLPISYATVHFHLLVLDVASTEINTNITPYFNTLESRALLVLFGFFGEVVLFLGWRMQ